MSKVMRSIVYSRLDDGGIRAITREMPVLSRRSDNVLCKIKYAGVNPVDAKYCIGDKVCNNCYILVITMKSSLSQLPKGLEGFGKWCVDGRGVGFDFCGEVVDVPNGCEQYRVGDIVFGTLPPFVGSLAEYAIAPMDQIALKPSSLSCEEAACLPLVGLTCLQALGSESSEPSAERGKHILIVGASGGVGHVAVQVAKLLGYQTTGICSARNFDFVRAIGGENLTLIDYTVGTEAVKQGLIDSAAQRGHSASLPTYGGE